jgi:polyhydroxyalkanoate synthesis regulator phasin
MLELLKKGIFTGIGLSILTKDKIEEVVKKTIQEAKLSEEEGKKLLASLLEQSDEYRTNLEIKIHEQVNKVMDKLDLPSKKEFEALKKELEELKNSKS